MTRVMKLEIRISFQKLINQHFYIMRFCVFQSSCVHGPGEFLGCMVIKKCQECSQLGLSEDITKEEAPFNGLSRKLIFLRY